MLPCRKMLFFGSTLHTIQRSLCSESETTDLTCSLSWTFSRSSATFGALSLPLRIVLLRFTFLTSSKSDMLLSECWRFLLMTLSVFLLSDKLPEDRCCFGTTILSSCRDGNSWLEPIPESWELSPLRHDLRDSSLTGSSCDDDGWSCCERTRLCLLGRGGKKLFRT